MADVDYMVPTHTDVRKGTALARVCRNSRYVHLLHVKISSQSASGFIRQRAYINSNDFARGWPDENEGSRTPASLKFEQKEFQQV